MKLSSIVAAAAVSAAALAAMPAAAQTVPSFYGNLGYTYADADNANLGVIAGRAGVKLHQNFGVEGELGFGVKGDETTVSGVKVESKLTNTVAVYGVGFLPVNDKIELLARVGYGASRFQQKIPGFQASDTQNSWNYGVGAQYAINDANGVRVDYTRHDFDGDIGDVNAWAVSYVRKF